MACKASAEKELDDMTECRCSICTEVFTDPRVLPCVHTFCLKCLQKYGNDRQPGDDMPCPLCRKEFTIPEAGFLGVQKNFFMEQLLHVIYRKQCSQSHSVKATADRVEKEIGKHVLREEIHLNLSTTCDIHENKELEVFCLECKLAVCVKCFIKSHKTHDCSDITAISDDLCKQVKSDIDKITGLLKKIEEISPRFDIQESNLVDRLADTEIEINTASDQLIAVVQRHQMKLLSEVESIKQKQRKHVEMVKQEVKQHAAVLETLKQYSETLLSSGTPCDVIRSANSLHKRADELMMFDIIGHVDSSLPPVTVIFTSLPVPDRYDGNIIGNISAEGISHEADVDVTDDGRHGDEEQPPHPAPADDIQPPTLTRSRDEIIILPMLGDVAVNAEASDRPSVQQSLASEKLLADEMGDEVAVSTAADEDDITDEPQSVQQSLTQAKPELKYQYSEDQWSPLNPEGKKQYDRNFMLKLQYEPSSMTRPANLPVFLDIILDEPAHVQGGDMGMRHHNMELGRSSAIIPPDFTPGFIKASPSGGRGMQRGGPGGSASSMKKGKPGLSGRQVIQMSLQQDVKLHTPKNARKPVVSKKDAANDDEDAATQQQQQSVQYGGQSSWQHSQQQAAHPSSQPYNAPAAAGVHPYPQQTGGGNFMPGKSDTAQRHPSMYNYGGSGTGGPPSMMTQPMQHQPPQHHTAPASSSSEHQQQQPPRRTKHALKIVDPNTGKNVVIGGSADQTSTDQSSTSVMAASTTAAVISSESQRASPTKQVAAEFAAKVAAVLHVPRDSSRSVGLRGGSDGDVEIKEQQQPQQ